MSPHDNTALWLISFIFLSIGSYLRVLNPYYGLNIYNLLIAQKYNSH